MNRALPPGRGLRPYEDPYDRLGPHPGDVEEPADLDLRAILGLIRRNSWLIAGCLVVAIGLASLFFGEGSSGLALRVVIIALAALTNLTAIHRIIWVYQYTREPPRTARRRGSARDADPSGQPELTVGTREEAR